MNTDFLFAQIRQKKSFLCIGLDTDINKIPVHLKNHKNPVFNFNKQIIDATVAYTVAYKPNLAFYESRGIEGWRDLELTVEYLRKNYPDLFLIADAKRGDIGNSSKMYAEAFFAKFNFDAVTVSPYMGEDSIKPFLDCKGKYVILLVLTSNSGADDFQYIVSKDKKPLFIEVIEKSKKWSSIENMMYVVGATKASMLATIRLSVPDHFLLVPGIGTQGGSLEEVAKYGLNSKCGLLVNNSRSIIYAGNSIDFAEKAAKEAKRLQQKMNIILSEKRLI